MPGIGVEVGAFRPNGRQHLSAGGLAQAGRQPTADIGFGGRELMDRRAREEIVDLRAVVGLSGITPIAPGVCATRSPKVHVSPWNAAIRSWDGAPR